jgi:sugar lactone lactonase YvrE
MKMSAATIALAAGLLLAPAAFGQAGEWRDGKCDGADAGFICGPVNAEDLLRVPGTNWVLGSSADGPGVTQGAIYLLNATSGAWKNLSLDDIRTDPDAGRYRECPGKPTTAAFRGHGMALDARGGLTLLAINHGGRESVEVFSVAVRGGAEPTLTWRGCVVAPANAYLNSVASTGEGGFAATKFFDPSNASWGQDLFTGRPTGQVLEWSPGHGWRAIDGTVMSGPNGLVVSPDGRAYFVAEWGGRKVHRIARAGSPIERLTIDVPMNPDNLHWDNAGRILATGQAFEDASAFGAFGACVQTPARTCTSAFATVRIDPATLASEVVQRSPGWAEFGAGTTALEVGDEIWIGTFRGERIARVAKQAAP